MRIAVFDLDGTITRRDTLPALPARLAAPASAARVSARMRSARLAALPRSDRDRGRLKSDLIRAGMSGATRDEVERWTAEYVAASRRAASSAPGRLAAIARHRAAGDRLVLLSASVDLYVPDIGRRLGLRRDDLHRSRLERWAPRWRARDREPPRGGEAPLRRGAARPVSGSRASPPTAMPAPIFRTSPSPMTAVLVNAGPPAAARGGNDCGFRTEDWRDQSAPARQAH